MANPDFAPGAFFKHNQKPVAVEAHQRKAGKAAKLAAAYEAVNVRDKNRCRVTGKPLSPTSTSAATRREHHHLRGRNVKPEWRDDPRRIVLVSALAHHLITKGWLLVDDDANKPLNPRWAEWVTAKDKPFRLRSERP